MINIINTDKFIKEHKCLGPITTSQIYLGKSDSFNPVGLYSEEIFGVEGSTERKDSFSWVELNCNVIHPVLYDVLQKRIFRKINDLLSGEKTFSLDPNGYLIEDELGDINGMSSFIENIKKIRFKPSDVSINKEEDEQETDRDKIINMMYRHINNDTFFMNKLIIIGPDFRPIFVVPETGEVRIDEISKLYQKIIMASTQLKSVSGILGDTLTYRMQLLLRDLYELIKVKIAKKNGMIRKLMLGARSDFSGRTVISPNPQLKIGQIGLPLRMAVQLFEPFVIFGITKSSYSNSIPDEFHKAVKEFLARESETLI